MIDNTCPTRLIDDLPTANDAFGSHRATARAISEMIVAEAGGRAIGLAGGYGAGKSSVVEMVKANLESSERILVWTFDAWAHEGDPLRRTFLESLIDRVSQRGWVDKHRWQRRRDLLARRRKEQTTTAHARVTTFGFYFFLSLFLVPVGAALLAAAFEAGHALTFDLQRSFSWPILQGLLLALAPALVVGIRALLLKVRSEPQDSREWGELLALVTRDGASETLTRTTESPEPTSLEFAALFMQLIDEALADRDRRFLIVVDNLDRVAPKVALELWATLQAFYGTMSISGDSIWVLLPYDEGSIRRLWAREDGANTPADGFAELAQAFLDKTFVVRFDVAPPLLSDQRTYMRDLFNTALPEHGLADGDDEQFIGIFSLFQRYRQNQSMPALPREMKTFVNQLGALHRQWPGHEVDIRQMAFFALMRQRYSVGEIIDRLRDDALYKRSDEIFLGPSPRSGMAALAFGTGPARAGELLLGAPVDAALRAGDSAQLVALKGEGFPEVLSSRVEELTTQYMNANSPDGYALAVALLGDPSIESGPTLASGPLSHAIGHQSYASEWPESTLLGIALIIERCDSRTARRALSDLQPALSARLARGPAQDFAAQASVLLKVQSAIRQRNDLPDTKKLLIPDPNTLLAILRAAYTLGHGTELVSLLSPGSPRALSVVLEASIRAGEWSEVHERLREETASGGVENELVLAARERLRDGDHCSSQEASLLLNILNRASEPEHDWAELVRDGTAARILALLADSAPMNVLAELVARFLRVTPVHQRYVETEKNKLGYDKLEQLLREPSPDQVLALSQVLDARAVVGLGAHEVSRELAGAVISVWKEYPDRAPELDPTLIAENWSLFAERSASDGLDFVQKLGLAEPMAGLLTSRAVSWDEAGMIVTVLRALPPEGRDRQALREHIVAAIEDVPGARWSELLSSDSIDLQVKALRQLQPHLPRARCDALREALVGAASASISGAASGLIAKSPVSVKALCDLLTPAARLKVADALLGIHKTAVAPFSTQSLGAFGELLMEATESLGADRLILDLLVPFVERGSGEHLGWVQEYVSSHGSRVAELDKVLRKALLETLDARPDSEVPEYNAISAKLRASLSEDSR